MVTWSLTVSDDVDKALRTFLDRQNDSASNFSQFVEEAVKERLFYLTVEQVKTRNSRYDQNEIMKVVEEAVDWTRETSH